jgi:LacI family transcriptional regulator
LRKKTFLLIVSSSENDPKLEQDEIEDMIPHRLDCIVVASCQKDTENLHKIGEAGVPLVLIDRSFQGFSCNFVGVNEHKIGKLATEHLFAQGYERIAHIRGPATIVGNSRANGYRDAIQCRGLPTRADYVIGCGEGFDSDGEVGGRKAMEEVLSLRPRPDALFCFDDSIAVGAMVKIFEAGLRIPEDIALLGCGDFHYCNKLRVPLSSIDRKAREIGERAALMIAAIIGKPHSRRPRTVILEPELIVRASSQSRNQASIDASARRC